MARIKKKPPTKPAVITFETHVCLQPGDVKTFPETTVPKVAMARAMEYFETMYKATIVVRRDGKLMTTQVVRGKHVSLSA